MVKNDWWQQTRAEESQKFSNTNQFMLSSGNFLELSSTAMIFNFPAIFPCGFYTLLRSCRYTARDTSVGFSIIFWV